MTGPLIEICFKALNQPPYLKKHLEARDYLILLHTYDRL